jgi:hypothetical protein
LHAPPEPGSLREALCLLVFRYRREQEFYSVYSALHGEGTKGRISTANKYREAMFPFAVRAQETQRSTSKEIMDAAFAAGPFFKVTNEEE